MDVKRTMMCKNDNALLSVCKWLKVFMGAHEKEPDALPFNKKEY